MRLYTSGAGVLTKNSQHRLREESNNFPTDARPKGFHSTCLENKSGFDKADLVPAEICRVERF